MKKKYKVVFLVLIPIITYLTNTSNFNKVRTNSPTVKKQINHSTRNYENNKILSDNLNSTNKNINITSKNVIVENIESNIFSYQIFYDKYVNNAYNGIYESYGNKFSNSFKNNITDYYLNGKVGSVKSKSGNLIGGIPIDKIENISILIDLPNQETKQNKTLNLVNDLNLQTIRKNTEVKFGTDYFTIVFLGTVTNPSIFLYKNYVDFFTSQTISIKIGHFLSNDVNPKNSRLSDDNSLSAEIWSRIGILIIVGGAIFLSLLTYIFIKFGLRIKKYLYRIGRKLDLLNVNFSKDFDHVY